MLEWHTAERELASSLASTYKGSNPIQEGITLITQLSPKASPSNTTPLGLGFQHMRFVSQSVSQFSHSVVCDFLQPHGLQRARLPRASPPPGACSNSSPSSW